MTFSGSGTGLFNQSEGQRNTVSAGTSSNLSYSTNISTSPNYGGSTSIGATLSGGEINQAIGVSTEAVTGQGEAALSGNAFNGVFRASISTESGSNNTDSSVDITGLMAQTTFDTSGTAVSLDTQIADPEMALENGTASASAVIASGTMADAAISGSTFASGFMQYFAPGAGFDSVSFDGGHEGVELGDGSGDGSGDAL